MKCKNCGGPLDASQTQCPYCGVRHEIDLRGIKYTNQDLHTDMMCPRCKVPLNSISIGEGELITIERCEQCQGMFFNPGELEYVLVNSIPIVYTIDRERITALKREAAGNNRESRYIKCPACAELMNYINYKKESGVIVDWCKLHGLWLDGGELRQLLEWRKAGGMLKYEQNQSSFSKMPPPPSTRLQPQDSSRKPKMDLETYRRKDYNENDITGLIGNIISEILFRW